MNTPIPKCEDVLAERAAKTQAGQLLCQLRKWAVTQIEGFRNPANRTQASRTLTEAEVEPAALLVVEIDRADYNAYVDVHGGDGDPIYHTLEIRVPDRAIKPG